MSKLTSPIIRLKSFIWILLILAVATVGTRVQATVDDALSFAYEAAAPYVAEGFLVREEAWAGDLGVGEEKGIAQQLFKGNEYWFWLATDEDNAELAVHAYDSKGDLVDVESWQKGRFAATRVIPKTTGTYYLLVTITKGPEDGARWAMVYGFR